MASVRMTVGQKRAPRPARLEIRMTEAGYEQLCVLCASSGRSQGREVERLVLMEYEAEFGKAGVSPPPEVLPLQEVQTVQGVLLPLETLEVLNGVAEKNQTTPSALLQYLVHAFVKGELTNAAEAKRLRKWCVAMEQAKLLREVRDKLLKVASELQTDMEKEETELAQLNQELNGG